MLWRKDIDMTNEEKLLAITDVLKAHNRPNDSGLSDDMAIFFIEHIVHNTFKSIDDFDLYRRLKT